MWDLPRPGLEPVSPALAGRFSTAAPPGKPYPCFMNEETETQGTPVICPKSHWQKAAEPVSISTPSWGSAVSVSLKYTPSLYGKLGTNLCTHWAAADFVVYRIGNGEGLELVSSEAQVTQVPDNRKLAEFFSGHQIATLLCICCSFVLIKC